IRGIYTGSQQLTSTTAYYLDEAALSASGFVSGATFIAPDADLVDVDHIEVLKGPQGTLYGASALGGILRIISRKPDLSAFGGTAEADFSTV
ncbi:TonB-dependent receptor plug domain-containing protein, partial [Staphylococcus aureus]